MAASSKQIRRSVTAPDKVGGLSRLSPTLDATVLIVGTLVGALVLGLSLGAREWMAATLAFGWIPVAAWVLAVLGLLRFRPQVLFRFWRWAVGAAGGAAISVGILSFFNPGLGILADVSLGGLWGGIVGGSPLGLGLLKLVAIAGILPLVMYPKRIGGYYLRSVCWVGVKLGRVLAYVYRRFMGASRYLAIKIGLFFNGRYRRRLFRRVGRLLIRLFPAKPRPAALPAAAPMPALPDPGASDEGIAFWEGEVLSAERDLDILDSVPVANGAVIEAPRMVQARSQWQLPSVKLLAAAEPYSAPQESLDQMARHIESTLADHGVTVEVKDIKAGPRIVRFGLVPGWVPRRGEFNKGNDDASPERSRVKVQSILAREKDLALALKTPYLRIEAPVPGEALVGLEVPNPSPSKVPLRQVMDAPQFKKVVSQGGLPIALGEDTGGNAVVTDLAALPHMLIAGATGSGKSVCINSIVASLLFTKPPDQLRMLMVDPKRVELTPFNGIPHLISPVIVDIEEVNPALRGLMREMFCRYKLMEESGTRNIAGYNAKIKEKMPYLVLIVDELADLMMVGGFEIEQNLVRLAQLGRATGIHLVLATQRPSVNVVTGLLKANIPARVAFAVASQVDSRVILDTIGAEKLLGKGDMLLLNNDSPKARRVQGTLVYDEEVDQLVEFWLGQKGPPLPLISIDDLEDDEALPDDLDDQMVDRARDLALRNPHLSTSLLERRLSIGGYKAAQIIEVLEDEGLVIPH